MTVSGNRVSVGSRRIGSLSLAVAALVAALIGVAIHLFQHPSLVADLLVSLSVALCGGTMAVRLIRQGRAWAWIILVVVVAYPIMVVVMYLRPS